MTRNRCIVAVLAALACAAPSLAQWTNDPANPRVIGDTNSDIPTMVATADGGAFVAWQGTGGGGMWNTVHIQKLDGAGNELWGHNGIVAVVGNNSATFVGDFDIALASDGNLLVVSSTQFTDAAYPTVRQAAVQKFAATDGHKMWGTGGADVGVSSGALGGWPSRVAPTPDGGCIVGYTAKLTNGNGAIRFMRMSSTGTPVWPSTTTVLESSGNVSLSLVQLVSGGTDSSVIALWGAGVNGSQVGLHTQKFTGGSISAPGAIFSGWGTTGNPLVIETTGMTQYNYYQARMLSDNNGGAIYGWSSFTSGFAGCATAFLQHIQSSGVAKFASPVSSVDHAVVACGGMNGTGQYSARPAFRQDSVSPPSFHYFLASEQGPSANGSVQSTLVQKFDNTGARLWSDSGVVIVPPVNSGPNWVNPAATSDGGCVCIGNFNAGLTYGSDATYATKVVDDPSFPGSGMMAWRTIVNSNTAVGKGRMAVVTVAGSDDLIVAQETGSSLSAFKVAAADGAPGSNPVAPTIDVDVPSITTACDGDTVVLSVQVSGTAPMTFQWQRHYAYTVANPDAAWGLNDGDSSFQCIIPADGTTYSGTNTATLTIHNVHANNPTATCPNSDPALNMYRLQVFNAASPSGQASTSSWAQVVVGAGACCAADGSCSSVCTPASCTGVYQGTGSVCSPNPCGGACCGATACTITSSTGCTGAFQGNGTTCNPVPCAGVCCDNTTGACSTTVGAASCGSGVTFQAFVASCTPEPCPQPGACCNNANSVCTTVVQASCTLGSTFHGVGSSCDSDPCAPVGACCSTIDGTYCATLTQSVCVGIGTRRWQGSGTTCGTIVCPQPEACCNPATGACTFVSAQGCASPSVSQGEGTFCTPNDCPQPAICCDASTGACSIVASAAQCGGLSMGGTTCTPSPCPAPIACCAPTGCSLSLAVFCGSPAPNGATSCTPAPCNASGTCCRGATCTTTFTTASACTGSMGTALAGSVFVANGGCNASGNNRTPCCYADYNKVGGLSVQDIFDFLNDWFAGRQFAAVGTSGTGATLNVQNIFDFLNTWFAGC
jgi:hypothetical protein